MFHSRLVREIGVTLAFKLLLLATLWFAFFSGERGVPTAADHLLAAPAASSSRAGEPGV